MNDTVSEYSRTADYFSYIDPGFLNRRLAISALGPLRQDFINRQKPGVDHMTVLANDHLLVEMLIDHCTQFQAPTLAEALSLDQPKQMFMSTERLEPCEEIYDAARVSHKVHFDLHYGKPVIVTYHTGHIVSETGKMTLAGGYKESYRQSIIGCLHNRPEMWEIEPIVMGAPWLDHPRNKNGAMLMWYAQDHGEILPEDITEFSRLSEMQVSNADEWMSIMKKLPERHVKGAFAKLLNEPMKNDWGGEENDHYSSNVTVGGRRKTAAFVFKGPGAGFREMTPAMCGKQADQILRLAKSEAEISVIQHCHLIGSAVRETIRRFTVTPGTRSRKYCIIDGQATYKILKAYCLSE